MELENLAPWLFRLGVIALLAAVIRWLRRGNVFCPGQLFVPFLILAVLALDGGLIRLLRIVGLAARMGDAWPPHDAAWLPLFRAAPLVLALAAAVWGFLALVRVKFPMRLSAATALAALAALGQGVASIRWISGEQIMEVITSHALDPPWTTVRALVPGVLALVGALLILSVRCPRRIAKEGGEPA